MAPFSTVADMKQAVHNMLVENCDESTREPQRKQNRGWIKYYKNEINRKEDESKTKRTRRK